MNNPQMKKYIGLICAILCAISILVIPITLYSAVWASAEEVGVYYLVVLCSILTLIVSYIIGKWSEKLPQKPSKRK